MTGQLAARELEISDTIAAALAAHAVHRTRDALFGRGWGWRCTGCPDQPFRWFDEDAEAAEADMYRHQADEVLAAAEAGVRHKAAAEIEVERSGPSSNELRRKHPLWNQGMAFAAQVVRRPSSFDSCPNSDQHTARPDGFTQWFAWAEQMRETHTQQKCGGCDGWEIWVPKASDGMNESSSHHMNGRGAPPCGGASS